MPLWFYPLMLVIILAGYVFLFLQLRSLTRAQEGATESLRRHLERIDLSLSRMLIHKPAEAEAGGAQHEELRRALGVVEERLEGLAEAVSEAASRRENPPESSAVAAASARAPRPETPESVARRFLLEEGFSAIRVLGRDEREDATRLRVRAMRGDQLRSGHVTVRKDAVVEASMEVPTSLFP